MKKCILLVFIVMSLFTNAFAFEYYYFNAENNLSSSALCTTNASISAYGGKYIDTGNGTNAYVIMDFDVRTSGEHYIFLRIADDSNEDPLSFSYQTYNSIQLVSGRTNLTINSMINNIWTNLQLDNIVITDDVNYDANIGSDYIVWNKRYTNQFYDSEYKDVTISWNEPTEDQQMIDNDPCQIIPGTNKYDEIEYKLYYGTTSGIYNVVLNTGTSLTYRVNGLSETQIQYVAVTSINPIDQNESAYSCELTLEQSVPPVLIDPPSGTFTNSVIVSLSSIKTNALIYYTTYDEPLYTNSLVYNEPFLITQDTSFKIQSAILNIVETNGISGLVYTNEYKISPMQYVTYNIINYKPNPPGGVQIIP